MSRSRQTLPMRAGGGTTGAAGSVRPGLPKEAARWVNSPPELGLHYSINFT